MLKVIERVIRPAWLSAGSLVGKTTRGKPAQPKERGDQEESERARADDAVYRTTKVQLATCSIWTYANTSNTHIQHVHHVIAKDGCSHGACCTPNVGSRRYSASGVPNKY